MSRFLTRIQVKQSHILRQLTLAALAIALNWLDQGRYE